MLKKIGFVFFLLLSSFFYSIAQNQITPLDLKINTTFQHIAVHYDIDGDDNLNSAMIVRYREQGVTSPFEQAAMTMRAHPSLIVDGNPLNRNFHAGSIVFLQPNTTYEVEVELTDVDGGSLTQTVIASTQPLPIPSASASTKYVVPGTGGGSGTSTDPYQGLQAAADQAVAGDVFEVAAGLYEAFSISTNGLPGEPIVFKSETLHEAIIDGDNTNRGVVTIGVFDDSTQHIIIDGFIIQNGRWGIDAQNTQYFSLKNNQVLDVDYGLVNRRANGWEHDQYITNNLFEGRTPWPQTNGNIPGERGVDIRGNKNVVSFNTISYFGDGVSTDGPPYGESYCLDIHNNDIFNIVDDMIEVDGMVSNAVVYENRGFNGRMGVSVAPVLGGPCYIFRNIFYNLETSVIKLNRGPSGLVVCHNTGIKSGNGMSSPSGWQNTYFKNNVLMGTRYCFEEFGVVGSSQDDWNYNAYYSTRSGSSGDEWFKWDNVRYDDVLDLALNSPIEANGLSTAPAEFVDLTMPTSFDIEYLSEDFDFSLMNTSALINGGDDVDHLNARAVMDGMPDVGAYEFGLPEPEYGADFDLLSEVKIVLSNTDIEVFPNPSVHFITIAGVLGNYAIRILDLNGALVNEIQDVSGEHTLDVSALGSGLYFLEIAHNGQQQTCLKVIIKT